MFVAAYSVHLDNGWAAIAPSSPAAVCIPDSEERAASNPFERFVKCYNVNERTIEASERLARARSILREDHCVNVEGERHRGIAKLFDAFHRVESSAHAHLEDVLTK